MCVACVCADVGRVCLECGAGGSQRNPDSLRSSLEAGRLVVVQLLSCVRLCNGMDCSPPGSSVHGIFQARVLEWVATSSSRGSS